MQAAVFDTYVTTLQGGLMHFDIVVPKDTTFEQVTEWGKTYLKRKGQEGQPLSSKQCNFCHIEEANVDMEAAFKQEGYYIIEMEGCAIAQI